MIPQNFKLPIEYLDTKFVHKLSDVVINDLELVDSSTETLPSMYDVLLTPKHEFAKNMIQKWKTHFTSDVEFIQQSQEVIKNTNCTNCTNTKPNTFELQNIWKDIYETPNFHDRYSYIDIQQFHFVNNMSTFMGVWTIINLLSPVFSILLPLILVVAPFVLLKIQSVPINFDTYLTTLKDIAKKHTLGKAFNSIGDFSINNLLYILFTVAMYGMQMYQNVKSCIRFYKNINVVNSNLLTMKNFVNYSIENFDEYLQKNSRLTKYKGFCDDVSTNYKHLVLLREELKDVKAFSFGVSKCFEVGYLLKGYYSMFCVPEYKTAFDYAISFEGYRSSMESLALNIKSGSIHFGEICNNGKNSFTNQIYPALMDHQVENTVNLKKNLIITGPNASGKTTQLKSTAINVIFTQQFGVGFYEKCKLVPYTHIHSYLNIPDTSGRDSLFQAEARRCKEILDCIENDESKETSKHFCVFDELFSGTNAEEATQASFGFLKYLQKYDNVDFILTTHFVKLCQKIKTTENMRIDNYKMDAAMVENDISFTYKLVKGISKIKAARLILIQMGFPQEIYQ
jgi:hypothetical protein